MKLLLENWREYVDEATGRTGSRSSINFWHGESQSDLKIEWAFDRNGFSVFLKHGDHNVGQVNATTWFPSDMDDPDKPLSEIFACHKGVENLMQKGLDVAQVFNSDLDPPYRRTGLGSLMYEVLAAVAGKAGFMLVSEDCWLDRGGRTSFKAGRVWQSMARRHTSPEKGVVYVTTTPRQIILDNDEWNEIL